MRRKKQKFKKKNLNGKCKYFFLLVQLNWEIYFSSNNDTRSRHEFFRFKSIVKLSKNFNILNCITKSEGGWYFFGEQHTRLRLLLMRQRIYKYTSREWIFSLIVKNQWESENVCFRRKICSFGWLLLIFPFFFLAMRPSSSFLFPIHTEICVNTEPKCWYCMSYTYRYLYV